MRNTILSFMAAFGSCLVGLAADSVLSSVYDAHIAEYEQWPAHGEDFAVASAGAWRGTLAAHLEGAGGSRRLVLTATPQDLSFASEKKRAADLGMVVFAFDMRLTAFPELPDVVTLDKGGLVVACDGSSGAAAYYGRVADTVGGTNVWVKLAGVVPNVDADVAVEIRIRSVSTGHEVRYAVDGNALVSPSGEWSPLAVPAERETFGSFRCNGTGELASARMSVDEPPEIPDVRVIVPELANLVVTSVTASGEPCVAESDGTYQVPSNALVRVTFAPVGRYLLETNAISFTASACEHTLSADECPQPVHHAECLRVSEIMASNVETLRTNGGVAGLDWVEIHNVASEPIDITGWMLFDKPSKPSKWAAIEGPAEVPAGGYLVVFVDSDFTDWDARDVHAALGLSSGGEDIGLATPEKDVIADQFAFGDQYDDLSFGRGVLDSTEGLYYFATPTPGAANAEGRHAQMPRVTFSEPHGYKTAAFELTLMCPERPDAQIYYTLDGRAPTAASRPYTGPIAISSTTVVRAGVPDEAAVLQSDSAATYLFLDDILTQSEEPPEGFPADCAINRQHMVYGMSAAITQGDEDTRRRLVDGFTNSIRTVSLVADPADLFDKDKGIYVNAASDLECPVRLEQIDPVGGAANEFSVSAGLKMRGAMSVKSTFPKHSWRVVFRSEYGMNRLKFKLFGDEGTDSFKKIDFRTSQNYGWANDHLSGSEKDTLINECFSRDAQRDMGEPYNRSRFYNLFVNGVYWGVYMSEERVDDHYAESYNGGDSDHYDVIRTHQPGYVTSAVEGTDAAWSNLWSITVNEGYGASHPENYNRVRGLGANGERNPEYPIYLNVTNLIVYMLTAHYTGDVDSPASSTIANNIQAYRDRVDGEGIRDGFLYNRHDAEISLGHGQTYEVDTTTRGTRVSGNAAFLELANFQPAELHYELCANDEYRQTFADLVYRHCLRPGGALTEEKSLARFAARQCEIDDAVVCESARWGKGTNGVQYTRALWLTNCNDCVNFITNRQPYLIAAYRQRGWYPSVDAPAVTNAQGRVICDGERIDSGARIYLSGAGGTVYCTTDGSDPRLPGGAVSASATTMAEGMAVPETGLHLQLRVLADNGQWSALETLTLVGQAAPQYAVPNDCVRMAAIMSSTADNDGDGREFVVLTNQSSNVVALGGVRLTCAKTGKAPSLSLIVPLDTLLEGGAAIRFEKASDWPDAKITNGAVDFTLSDATGGVFQVGHVDASWWNAACDGTGAHFVAAKFNAEVTLESDWVASFLPPADPEAKAAVAQAVADDDRVREWMDALAQTAEGQMAISVFSGDAAALKDCYLVAQPPETEPAIVLAIPMVTFDSQGRPIVSGTLSLHGEEAKREVNGTIRLYHAASLDGLDSNPHVLDLGHAVPIPGTPIENTGTNKQFFKLTIE